MEALKRTIIILCLLCLVGCVTTSSPAQRYDDEMRRIAALYKQGLVTEPQKAKVVKYGEAFWLSYHQALDELEKFLGYTHSLPQWGR